VRERVVVGFQDAILHVEFVEKIVRNELKRDLAMFREELEKPSSIPMYDNDPVENAKKIEKTIKAFKRVLEFYGDYNA
jgi:flagellar motor switch protein FliG